MKCLIAVCVGGQSCEEAERVARHSVTEHNIRWTSCDRVVFKDDIIIMIAENDREIIENCFFSDIIFILFIFCK